MPSVGEPAAELVEELPAPLQRPLGWWLQFVLAGRDTQLAFAIALFLAVSLFAALGQLDAVLRAIHAPGDTAFGIGALSDPGLPPPEAGRVGDVVDTWLTVGKDGFTEPDVLAVWFVGMDVLFTLAYGWVLAVVLLRLRGWLLEAVAPVSIARAVDRRVGSGDVAAEPDAQSVEGQRIWGLAHRYARVLAVACSGVFVLMLADLLENGIQGAVVAGCVQSEPADWCSAGALIWSLYLVTSLKWLLVAAVLVTAGLGLLALASLRRTQVRELGRVLVRVRAPLALVAVLAAGYLVKATPFADQAADLLRRWQDEPQQAVFAGVTSIVLATLLLTCARGLIRATRVVPTAPPFGSRGLWIASVAVSLVGLVAFLRGPEGPGLLVLAGLLAAIATLGALAGPVDDDPPPAAAGTFGANAVPALLAAAPLVVLGLAVQGAALVDLAWAANHAYILWLVVGAVLQAVGWAAYWRFASGSNGRDPDLVIIAVGTVMVLGVTIWTWSDPWGVAGAGGGAAILTTFAIAMALIGSGLGWVAERTRPPAAVRLLGFRRTPFLLLLLAWGFSAAVVDKHGRFHDARLLGDAGPAATPRPGVTLEQTFERWRKARGLPDAPEPGEEAPAPSANATPLVLVAASGGGIRAAYWTAQTLDCLFGRRREGSVCPGPPRDAKPVIAASGVSGGSLGLTAWATHMRTPDTDEWVDTLEEDTLSPTLAWALFVDIPNSLLHTAHVPDRAEVLERSWEREWVPERERDNEMLDKRSPLAKGMFATGDNPPLLLLNATAVESACRVNVSVLNANVDQQRPRAEIEDCLSARGLEPGDGLGPDDTGSPERIRAAREEWALGATVDVNGFLCGAKDLRLSSAALLSARFPYVSPSGRLVACDKDKDEGNDVSTYLVDGGYFDSSAAGTAVQLWTALAPIVERYNAASAQCVVPFAIQIDNGYDEPPGPDPGKRPLESVAPLQTFVSGRDAGEADARQALALVVNKPVGGIQRVMNGAKEERRYAHIYPRAHPGSQAPLGWALSAATQDDLVSQLEPNADVMSAVREGWLEPDKLSCRRDPAPPATR